MINTEAGPQIRDFLAESFPNLQLGNEDDIFDLGVVNSLFVLQLVMFIEQRFVLTIPNEELELVNFRTIAAMSKLIARLTEATSND